ncbi:MAG: thioredoxin domain-containing protein [Clostridium sp.]|nr:thioredoxin domain-containing protein [Clostridium sp.]
MERESFEDQEVADILNKHFISIKVDKEERPEVDAIYMHVCQLMTGHGGWPLTILMTPEQKPFYACTYLPKRSSGHMIGLMNLLNAATRMWESDQEKLLRSSEEISDILAKEYQSEYSMESPSIVILERAVKQFIASFDEQYGGFGQAPKFPSPHNLLFLLRFGNFNDEPEVIGMVEKTLEKMYQGGIYDHIGGGFSRYATDEKWLVPHFEKMLYDNALLVFVYLEAYQQMRNSLFLEVVEQTLNYVMREMVHPKGGFYSAQDADSEGVEGKYYTFTPEEIKKVLGAEAGEQFNSHYEISEEGNFEGKNIPNRIHARELSVCDEEVNHWREEVYQYRLERTKLHKDDKILTSWNALMIAAFARASAVLQNEEYREYATRGYQFIEENLRNKEGRLLIRYRDGEAAGLGNIDDYAFLLLAQLELYEASFDIEYLKDARANAMDMISLFWDGEAGGFFYYGNDAKKLIVRPKEVYDGAIPSGNSVATYGLMKLQRILDEEAIENIVKKQMAFMAGTVKEHPAAYSFALCAFMLDLYPMKELVGVTWNADEIAGIHCEIYRRYYPNMIVLLKTMENEDEQEELVKYTKEYKMVSGKSTFYLCVDKSCMPPFTGVDHIHMVL